MAKILKNLIIFINIVKCGEFTDYFEDSTVISLYSFNGFYYRGIDSSTAASSSN